MMKGEVTIKISKDGATVEADAEGFEGKNCTDLMEPVMKALGTVTEKKLKPDYYKKEHAGVTIGH